MKDISSRTGSLLITNKTSRRIPRVLLQRVFHAAKKKNTMEVSLVFLDDAVARALNKKWRNKDKQANVLAFRLDERAGEIVINPYEAGREAHVYGVSYQKRTAYLFLHGLLHLYGYDHKTEKDAKKMEHRERFIMHNINIIVKF
jgi:rRNA maturation RNase YbeY